MKTKKSYEEMLKVYIKYPIHTGLEPEEGEINGRN